MPKIKINDMFSIERDPCCWILSISTPGINPKTKESVITTKDIYPATLIQCFDRIIDISAGEAKSIHEMKSYINNTRNEILKAIKENNLGFDSGNGTKMDEGNRGSKGECKRSENNNSDETKRVDRKETIEQSTRNKKMDSTRKQRTGRPRKSNTK